MSRLAPGDLVSGKYRIVRLIGDGGMGVVFEARHEVLGHGVALKFLHADLAKRPGLTQRFLQEARVSATIQSPHVTHVTDVDTAEDGAPYLVMELLSGQSLQALLDWQGKLPVEQAVDFGLQILAGLEAAHAMGVVHRDMKPDNVFVTASAGGPLLKLIDFGIAKLRAASEATKGLTRAGVVMGTPEYMAPEQLTSAHTADLRADIYSFGVMLFEMLGGCRPADGDDVEIIVAAVLGGRVRRLAEVAPGLPEGLVALVERAMAPEREDRFENAGQMRLALAPFAGHLSHAGRLAAIAAPLAPSAPLETSLLSSFPSSSVRPPPSAVPKTVPPPEAPPLSVSQLGAARTSISNDPPTERGPMTGTAMGGGGPPYAGYAPPPAPPYAASPYGGGAAVPPTAPGRPSGRSGWLIALLVVVVLGGGGAVGYAAYRAADGSRVVTPPLPTIDPLATAPKPIESIQAEGPGFPSTPPISAPTTAPRPPAAGTGPKPSSGSGAGGSGAGGSVSNPGQVVVIGAGGTSGGIQLPFPLPSSIQIPTAIPSQIQLPPGISFPPGFPGVGQPTTPTTPTSTPTVSPGPTSQTPTPTPTPTPTTTSTRPRSSSKP